MNPPINQNPPIPPPRKGWDSAFQAMHENGDVNLLIDDVFEEENFEEWVSPEILD